MEIWRHLLNKFVDKFGLELKKNNNSQTLLTWLITHNFAIIQQSNLNCYIGLEEMFVVYNPPVLDILQTNHILTYY